MAKLVPNKSTHPCERCIHEKYCGRDALILIKEVESMSLEQTEYWRRERDPKTGKKTGGLLIPIPKNCPIITKPIWSVS